MEYRGRGNKERIFINSKAKRKPNKHPHNKCKCSQMMFYLKKKRTHHTNEVWWQR